MTTDNTSDRSNNVATKGAKRTNRARIAIFALAIAGSAGAGGYVAGAQQPASTASPAVASVSSSPAYAMNRALAQFAVDNNLTGLSPASLGPKPAETLAQFARENNLTGLSPSSLAPIDSDQGE